MAAQKTNQIGEWAVTMKTEPPMLGQPSAQDGVQTLCIKSWQPIVSTVFHGHDHQYAYESRDGVIYTRLRLLVLLAISMDTPKEEPHSMLMLILNNLASIRVSAGPSSATVSTLKLLEGR